MCQGGAAAWIGATVEQLQSSAVVKLLAQPHSLLALLTRLAVQRCTPCSCSWLVTGLASYESQYCLSLLVDRPCYPYWEAQHYCKFSWY